MRSPFAVRALLVFACFLSLSLTADAQVFRARVKTKAVVTYKARGCPGGQCARPVYVTPAPAYLTPAPTAPAKFVPSPVVPTFPVSPPPTYPSLQVGAADPYGFVTWLNGYRARYGLRSVAYDATLASWAAANNAQQNSRGLGHFVMGPSRVQNSGWAPNQGVGVVENMWVRSPAHNANLLNPSITRIGIAGSGAYWTFDGA